MRLEKMIVDEDKKREKKNENLMIELCESFLMLFCNSHSETIKRCVRFLLVVAMNKGENEDTKKEVEMALLALSCSSRSLTLGKNRYLDKIAEIIQYDQKHHNLTQLAQQSAWKFLVDRFYNEAKIVRELVKELHFAREATRELNELTKHVLGKKKESEWKKMKEALIIWGWVCTVKEAFFFVRSWKNEPNRLIRYLVRLCRAARETERDIFRKCIEAFIEVSQNRSVSIDVMIKEAAFDPLMEEIHQSTFSDAIMISIFRLFLTHFERLKEKEQDEAEKEKRKATKKMTFEKLEEEGYEDAIASFRGLFDFLNKKFRNYGSLSLDISKYFVYA
ncbi:uncharacterized protein MONOS_11630 [Monocercomonoides exilis]|uniref:uncharacterized protein n=1 Tax=Monocercomonoides exilis TaxID=2049356 RepID=UPI00355AC375|nr:hypothetical protein MONOS_11630 [Monocercomonoides exilis]|eukprot:MONOS_11630.1-p1 / transcript=MONOS_11630.1 / gene=MONOS_11630 / organism=Monocercomonoides_exilis_PA203 / gene_product=unspecified product / transcript_product=unspecified product / location=Mono_scaffold00595:11554-12654(-) / protein_length=334 / sequence_SO=supercontig / SO=protein_coding / is_pseudo=false